uniref:Uncharacterized protein n=1 Tax=Timema douglasi TaxID=61478 RepID=A0A7R8VBQ3_TIMDO|nr:unnamed protein product [Timema douglasi]
MDAVYPEPMSRLHRRTVRKPVHRGPAGRYRTQPVTFSEIKEVDEENIEDNSGGVERSAGAASKSEIDLNSKFEEFWRLGQEKKNKKKAKEATMLAPRHTMTEPLSKICPLTTSNSNP